MKKLIVLALLVASSCSGRYWSEPSSWYSAGTQSDSSVVDVFYIVSTNVVSSHSADGAEVFNAVLDSAERVALFREMDFVRSEMFPDSVRFFSPYYHQVTMDGLTDAGVEGWYSEASREIRDAFDCYMRKWNGGRRFILAGFSQGAMLVVDLLKTMSDRQYSRLVAAYAIGYGLDAEDIADPHVVPASGPYDTGVTVSFNTVADTSGIWPLVYNDAVTCINPVGWTTDATASQFVFDSGSVSLTASVDTLRHVVVVPGFEPEPCPFWPASCLHLYDLLFYTDLIRENALLRAR